MLPIEWASEQLVLSGARAVFWPARRTVIVADIHFGKAASFRRLGVPVPAGTSSANLERLSSLIADTAAERLVTLGDFAHARDGLGGDTAAQIAAWRDDHGSLDIVLVRGNHDRSAGDPPGPWRFECVDEPWRDGPFVMCHDPEAVPRDAHGFAGHVHPAVILRDDHGGRMRSPCFIVGKHILLLPAFGSFTGARSVRPSPGDRVFVTGDDSVVEAAVRRPLSRAPRSE